MVWDNQWPVCGSYITLMWVIVPHIKPITKFNIYCLHSALLLFPLKKGWADTKKMSSSFCLYNRNLILIYVLDTKLSCFTSPSTQHLLYVIWVFIYIILLACWILDFYFYLFIQVVRPISSILEWGSLHLILPNFQRISQGI